ncbi:hypothetical protein [Bdellovibrio bacteriovorus]|uniref:hypothetical protein n=1 Tax=Bdellovibrio bacteriovorus TaxID=959 RepID=UPI0035A6A6B4
MTGLFVKSFVMALLFASQSYAFETTFQANQANTPNTLAISCQFGFVKASADENKIFTPSAVQLELSQKKKDHFVYTAKDPSGLYGQIVTQALGSSAVQVSEVSPWGSIYLFKNENSHIETLGYSHVREMLDVGGGRFIILNSYYRLRSLIFAFDIKTYDVLKTYGVFASGIVDVNPIKKLTEVIAQAVKEGRLAEGQTLGVGVESCQSSKKN